MLQQPDGAGGVQRFQFSPTSDPTDTEVESLINEIEEYIEYKTGQAWRVKTATNEIHHVPQPVFIGYWGMWRSTVFLRHRPLQPLDSNQGDKVEFWNGSSWEDWLALGYKGNGPYDNRFWTNDELGIIYIRDLGAVWYREGSLRVTYRYGDSTVPKEIQHAATLLVASRLLENFGYQKLVPVSAEQLPDLNRRIERWREEAERIIEMRSLAKLVIGTEV